MIDPKLAAALINEVRGDSPVIACQSIQGPWMSVSKRPELDVPYSGCMGKGSSLALGIALARPDKKIILLDADGSLNMNLGTLVTISDRKPGNLVHFVFNNGVYGGTGGQLIAGANKTAYAEMAKGAGYTAAYDFEDIEDLASHMKELMSKKGPVFVALRVSYNGRADMPAGMRRPGFRESLPGLKKALAGK